MSTNTIPEKTGPSASKLVEMIETNTDIKEAILTRTYVGKRNEVAEIKPSGKTISEGFSIISRGEKKAMILRNGKTYHLKYSSRYNCWLDCNGNSYEISD